jgi:hypothetical protein
MTKRGRKPIGRKAMTAAERQARRRAKLRKIAKDALRRSDEYRRAPGEVSPPPHGYNKAKAKLQARAITSNVRVVSLVSRKGCSSMVHSSVVPTLLRWPSLAQPSGSNGSMTGVGSSKASQSISSLPSWIRCVSAATSYSVTVTKCPTVTKNVTKLGRGPTRSQGSTERAISVDLCWEPPSPSTRQWPALARTVPVALKVLHPNCDKVPIGEKRA